MTTAATPTEPVATLANSEALYKDILGHTLATTWDEVFKSVERIKAYFQAVQLRFVEREYVIRQMMHAMMMREHIMINGPTGAAKSMLVDTVFSGIEHANVWSMELNRWTTDTKLFGNYDVREMKKSGRTLHMPEGSIAAANFAKTGEFFDCNDAALRALLGALNERRVQNGQQILTLPLLTAVADTNFSPETLPVNRRKTLEAVIDRFLFRVEVAYVAKPENRLAMLELSLDSVHSGDLPNVELNDFVIVSGVVRGMNLIEDPYVVQAYEEMTRRYSQKRVDASKAPLSDRRFIRGAQIMEISALLHGRQTVSFEDLEMTGMVLAHTDDDHQMLREIRREMINRWTAKASQREIEAERFKLTATYQDVPVSPDFSPMTLSELQRLSETIDQAINETSTFTTSSLEVGKERGEVMGRLFTMRDQLHVHMVDLVRSKRDAVPEKIEHVELGPRMQQINLALNNLRRINPQSESVLVKHTALMHELQTDKATLQMMFDGLILPEPTSEYSETT